MGNALDSGFWEGLGVGGGAPKAETGFGKGVWSKDGPTLSPKGARAPPGPKKNFFKHVKFSKQRPGPLGF